MTVRTAAPLATPANSARTVPMDAASAASGRAPRSLSPLTMLAPYVLRHKGMLALAAVALLTSAGATLGLPAAVRALIDGGFAAGSRAALDAGFAGLLLLVALLAAGSATRFYAVSWLGERVVAALRTDLFAHLARLSPAFHDRTHSAELMSRLSADTVQIKSAVASGASQLLRNAVMFIGALGMMLATSGVLSGLVVIAIPAIVAPLVFYGRAVRRLSARAQDELAEANTHAAESLAAVRAMQAAGAEPEATSRFAAANDEAFAAAVARTKGRARLTAIAVFLTFASILGVLWFGAQAVLTGQMTGGELAQFVLYAAFAGGAVAELSEVWGEAVQAAGAADRIAQLMAVVPIIASPARPVLLPQPATGRLVLSDVSFGYAADTDDVVTGLDLEARRGETVALVGPSGAGKSTIFSLALRFYDPRSGAVMLDGIDARAADLAAWRASFALVPQEIALFADTVAANIAYGRAASGTEIARAAQIARADGFIARLPDGYATRLGERGITLSGGERQRIAIARAVLRDAPVLLLDEATSSLDAENEALIQEALARASEGRTTLVIAHRLATVTRADRILVLEAGRIVEEGRHGALIARGGVYAALARRQFGADAGAALQGAAARA